MAAILHQLDQRRLIDTNGIADGASIYFYTTGTLTPAPVYTTAALSVEHSAPIVVAAGAAVPDIWLDSAVTYRRRIVYPDGSVDDTDPYTSGVLQAADLASTAAGKGAALFSLENGDNGQEAFDKRPVFDVRGIIGGDGEIAATLGIIKAIGGKAWIAGGSYTIASDTEIGDLQIDAHPGAVIAPAGGFTGTYLLRSTGTFTKIADLSGDVSAGGLTISFAAAHGLSLGDWFIIYDPTDSSFNAARTYYRDGEWCQVREVTSTTAVKVASPLKGGYAAATVDIYSTSLNSPSIRGGQWNHGAKGLFLFTGCTGRLTENIRTNGAVNQAIYTDRCVNFTVDVRDGFNSGSASSEDYCVVAGNSQHGRITGGRVYGRRHGVAIGGGDFVCSVPNRDVLVDGMRVENDPASGAKAADIHGNSDKCGYVDCNIYGGAGIGGLNPIYRGCEITSGTDGVVASVDEFKGGLVDLRRVTLITNVVNVTGGAGIVEFGAVAAYFNENTTDDVTLLLEDFVLEASSLAASEVLVRMDNSGSAAAFNPRIRRGTLRTAGNAIRILETNKTDAGATAASDSIIVEDFTPALPSGSRYHLATGDHYRDFPHRLPIQEGVLDDTTDGTDRKIGADTSFDVPYPRTPQAMVGAIGSQDGSAFDPTLGGTAIAVPYIYSLSSTAIRLAIRSADAANLGAAATFRVPWSVGLREL